MTEAQDTLLSPEATAQTETTSWYSEENKEVVERCGWKEPNDVIKSFRNVEKMSSGMAKMPTPESSAEEIRAFYQKTGCPENPEGYEVSVPEGAESFRNEDIEGTLKQIAYEQGVSKQAFESIVKGYYEKMASDLQAGRDAGEKTLREEFGDKYDESLAVAQRFCETCSDEFKQLLEQTGLGNNPIFIKEFLAKGKQIMSDTLIKGDAVGEKGKDEYVPAYKDSPNMYAAGDDEDSKKARAYFEARGHKY